MPKQSWSIRLKERSTTTLTLFVLALGLMGCGGFSVGGEYKTEPLPEQVLVPCPHPIELVSQGGTVADDEITMGRIGDALIECGQEKQIAIDGYNSLVQILVK